MKLITLCRILGIIFILSGVAKAFNVGSFAYEVRLYADAYFWDGLSSWATPIAVAVCAVEIFFGLLALRTAYHGVCSLVFFVLLSFFTWLTAVNCFAPSLFGSIESCGCFGELIHFSPLASFIKSSILLIFASISVVLSFQYGFTNSIDIHKLNNPHFTIAFISSCSLPLLSLFTIDILSPTIYICTFSILCSLLSISLWRTRNLVSLLSNIALKKEAPIAIIVLFVFFSSCSPYSKEIERTLKQAVENRQELISVLEHYSSEKKDSLKLRAAEFLIANMQDKFCYNGDILQKYDGYFTSLKHFREVDSITSEEDPRIKACWDSIVKQFGSIRVQSLNKEYDYLNLSANDLINNIEAAYSSRTKLPSWADSSHNAFLEYVLPYRISHEMYEPFRGKLEKNFEQARDTSKTAKEFLKALSSTFKYGKERFSSNTLKKYPIDLSLDQLERGRYGTCKQNAILCVSVLRALGIPSTIDYVIAWGNKGTDHHWPVMMLRDGAIFPFDSFFPDSVKFDYRPAKIMRTTYSLPSLKDWKNLAKEVPSRLWMQDAIDVTDQYGATLDIEIECSQSSPYKQFTYAVICVFDNKQWIPIWYGHRKDKIMHFSKMMANSVYMAAFWNGAELIPASSPFLLTEDGQIKYFSVQGIQYEDMVLWRKYPRFPRTQSFALESRWARVEGSNNPHFTPHDTLYLQSSAPIDITDTSFVSKKKYRYFRWVVQPYRRADLAEISFFGKMAFTEEEHELTGEIFGFPELSEFDPHPYTMAMDGNLESYYRKPKGDFGWVGIDLGKGKSAYLSRLRFCPRSDTNFILRGDTYELFYWQDTDWKSAGIQTALADSIVFKDVPSGTLYWLRDLTKGKEERPFTYENGKQVWW